MMARLSDIEANVERRFRELARTWNVLGDRLQTVEDILVDGDGLTANTNLSDDPAFKELSIGLSRLRSLETMPARLERLEQVAGRLDRLDKLDELSEKLSRFDQIESIAAKLDRLDRLDVSDTVEKKMADVETTFKRVLERIDALDRRMDTRVEGDFDLTPIRERLDDLNRRVTERPNLHAELAPVQHKIDSLSRLMSERPATSAPDMAPLNQRLDRLERMMQNVSLGDVDFKPIADRMERLERTIAERSTSGIDYGPIIDRFKEIENKISDANLLSESLGDRIDSFDSNVDAYRAQLTQATMGLTNEIKAVSGAVSAQQVANERLQSTVVQRLQNVETGNVDMSGVVSAVTERMQGTIGDVRQLVEADRKEQREQFEYLVSSLTKSGDDHRQDLSEVHEAMLKLNGNQQTLAQSMDRWRLDVSGDLGVLATRLEQVEGRVSTAARGRASRRSTTVRWMTCAPGSIRFHA